MLNVHWPTQYTKHTLSSAAKNHTTQHTHTFNSPFSGNTQVSWYQKGKNNLDFIEARDSEWQWHQLGHMQVCTSHQTDNHVSTPPLSFFTGRMPFLPPNQQHQSTEGKNATPNPTVTLNRHTRVQKCNAKDIKNIILKMKLK